MTGRDHRPGLFRADASACGASATVSNHTAIGWVSLGACDTSRPLPSGDQSYTHFGAVVNAVAALSRGSRWTKPQGGTSRIPAAYTRAACRQATTVASRGCSRRQPELEPRGHPLAIFPTGPIYRHVVGRKPASCRLATGFPARLPFQARSPPRPLQSRGQC